MKYLNRLRFWWARPKMHDELSVEIDVHRQMLEEEFIAQGMSGNEARSAALRRFGNRPGTVEQSREEWGFRWLDSLSRDVRFAFRLIRAQPLLTGTAIVIIGLGVGANSAIVSVLRTVMLGPLGLRDSGPVVAATVRMENIHMKHSTMSGVEFIELQAMTDAFSAVAAIDGRQWISDSLGEVTRLNGEAVTPDFFRVFAERPSIGRFFITEDRQVVVLSYALWKARFASDPDVLNRTLTLDGLRYRIVGVAPEDFRFPAIAAAWTPLRLDDYGVAKRHMNMVLSVFARLRTGVTAAQATGRVNRYTDSLKARNMVGAGYFIDIETFSQYVSGDLRRPLLLLFWSALAVLFTGCANIAALLLSRTAGRRREMAIRLSLGATRGQIARQLLVESALLGMFGGTFGIGVGWLALELMTHTAITQKSVVELAALDFPIVLFSFGAALCCSLLFGMAPAIQLLRSTQTSAMARGALQGFQHVFIAAQVGAALVLLIGTGLLMKSLWTVESIDPGFDSSNLTTAYLVRPKNDPAFLNRLYTSLRNAPGVESAALAYPIPFTSGGLTSSFLIEGREQMPGEPTWHGEAWFVSPNYFETLRIPLLRGRNFSDSDTLTAPHVCLIDEHLARQFFPNEDPVGRYIGMYGRALVVGVVRDVRGVALEEASRATVYYPVDQITFFPQRAIIVRSALPAGRLIRDIVRRTNGSSPVFDIRSMSDRIDESLGVRRVMAVLVCAFAAICILLAAIGLHGVVAQMVGERAPEIGVRMALGARPGQIRSQFLRYGLKPGAAGLVFGLGAALFAQRWLTSLLYEVKPFDPLTIASACAGIVVVLLWAVFWPARRASRIDPQSVLRHE